MTSSVLSDAPRRYAPARPPQQNPNLSRDVRDQIRRANVDDPGTVAHYTQDAGVQRVPQVVYKDNVVEEHITLGPYDV